MYVVSLLIYLEGEENKLDSIVSLVKSRYCQLSSVIIGVASNVKGGKIVSQMEYKELQGGGLYGIYTCGV
ncbi:hypothetical protein QOZ92_002281 [Paeniclostridium ghonii]|uniref:Uncharacterized protein n=2 Tax=Paraclostridium ghonii TaxID=29358 RepID=A0ABU0N1X5_9FIRM|nr:hypothetical protein [Paeniclostridium ghonii]